MNSDSPPVFGVRQTGATYRPRPGSYAVILGTGHTVAVIPAEKHGGYCLPGGGAEAGESVEQTLRREVLEECGHEIESLQPLAAAVEYLHAEGEGFFVKQCSFFLVRLGEKASPTSEHTLVWLPIPEVTEKLNQESQKWILSHIEPARTGGGIANSVPSSAMK